MSFINCVGCQTFRTIPQTGQQRRENLKPELTTLIDEFRTSVPKLMKQGRILGCSIALVDKQGMESILARNSCTLPDTEIAGIDPSTSQER